MATITTRSGKGSALTHQEVDANFTGLNTELGQKEVASNKGVANGYASLDAAGRVPSAQLPSYVDDVVEAANLASLPGTGETGKIYVTLDTNKTYRWSGSAYVEISPSPGSTDSLAEGSTNLYFTQARARASVSASGSLSYNSSTGVFSFSDAVTSVAGRTGAVTLTSSDVGLGNVENKSSATIRGELTSSNVTTALGFTPYNATNPSGYITSSASISGSAGSAPLLSALGSYVWSASTLPGSYSLGIQCSFVYSGWQSYGSVMTMNTYSGGGSALQMYVPYSPTYGGTGLQVRFGNYDVSNGNAWTAWKTLLASDNYNSYSPTLTGTGASGTWGINITGNAATATRTTGYALPDTGGSSAWVYIGRWSSAGQIGAKLRMLIVASAGFNANTGQNQITEVIFKTSNNSSSQSGSSGAYYADGMAFRSGPNTSSPAAVRVVQVDTNTYDFYGSFGNYSGISSFYTVELGAGGWTNSATIASPSGNSIDLEFRVRLDSGNYNSYALPLSGGTLTGNLTLAQAGTLPAIEFQASGVGASLNWRIRSGIEGVANGGFSIRDTTAGANRFWIDSSGTVNVPGALTQNGNQVLHAGNYTSYSPSLTGSGASGTWGINITGNAASATTAAKSSATTVPASTAFAKWMFATSSTSGTLDWNASSNTFPGVGETLLLGSAANGPGGGNYYHPFNIEYSGNEGNGQITQMAIAYGTPANELYMRGRYVGSWSSWVRYLNSSNYSSYAPTLTGGGASGTWGINITGNAATVTNGVTSSNVTSYAIPASTNVQNADLNQVYSSGLYGFDVPSNSPGFSYGHLLVMRGRGDTIGQLAIDYSSGVMSFRGAYLPNGSSTVGAAWSSWRRALDSANYSSYALPLAGGTMTGAIVVNVGAGGTNGTRGLKIGGTSNYDSLELGIEGGYNAQIRTYGNDLHMYAGHWRTVGSTSSEDHSIKFFTSKNGSANWSTYKMILDHNGDLTVSGNVTAYSDERVKANWRQLDDGFLVKLSGVKSGIYDRTDAEITQVGVSAQSLRDVLPHAVIESQEGDLSVAYGNAALVSAVELAKELVALKHKVAELEARVH